MPILFLRHVWKNLIFLDQLFTRVSCWGETGPDEPSCEAFHDKGCPSVVTLTYLKGYTSYASKNLPGLRSVLLPALSSFSSWKRQYQEAKFLPSKVIHFLLEGVFIWWYFCCCCFFSSPMGFPKHFLLCCSASTVFIYCLALALIIAISIQMVSSLRKQIQKSGFVRPLCTSHAFLLSFCNLLWVLLHTLIIWIALGNTYI